MNALRANWAFTLTTTLLISVLAIAAQPFNIDNFNRAEIDFYMKSVAGMDCFLQVVPHPRFGARRQADGHPLEPR
jgi:hypothetical protein